MHAALFALALAAAPFGSREELRGQVREVLLSKSCRQCHLGYLKTAQPKALKVFDLTKEDWPATMLDRQFRGLRGRLTESATAAQLDTVDRFIEAELKARQEGATSSAAPASRLPAGSSPARPEKAPSPPPRRPAP
ncbi:MAG TPA: hypothetical protein VFA20_22745 [Myxococcaceae bacterium]|nr:hypothetical protein [Myxococcaceae bacterium]